MEIIKNISDLISDEQLLRQMAEECCELAEVVLNIKGLELVSFFDVGMAYNNLFEEIADVQFCIDVFLFKYSVTLKSDFDDEKQLSDKYILERIEKEILRLSKLSLKFIRANEGTTPLSIEDARSMLLETMSNVVSYINMLTIKYPSLIELIDRTRTFKMPRWKERLENSLRKM